MYGVSRLGQVVAGFKLGSESYHHDVTRVKMRSHPFHDSQEELG